MKHSAPIASLMMAAALPAIAAEHTSIRDVNTTLMTSCVLDRIDPQAQTTAALLAKAYSDFEEVEDTPDGTLYEHASGITMVLLATETSHACTYTLPATALPEFAEVDIIEAVKTSFASNYDLPNQITPTDTGEVWTHSGPEGQAMSVQLTVSETELRIEALTTSE